MVFDDLLLHFANVFVSPYCPVIADVQETADIPAVGCLSAAPGALQNSRTGKRMVPEQNSVRFQTQRWT